MNRLLLLIIEHRENRRLLSNLLVQHYQILQPDIEQPDQILDEEFDLCIIDGLALDRFWQKVQARRNREHTVFLPFLLVTSRSDANMITRHLWHSIDELITIPIQKTELQARVEVLLRARQTSLDLQQRNWELDQMRQKEKELNQLKSYFVSMVSHEFRNPLTSIALAAHMLEVRRDQWPEDKQQEYFQRIQLLVKNMTQLLDDVLVIGKTDTGNQKVTPTLLDLSAFCHSLVDEIKLALPGAAIAYNFQMQSSQTQSSQTQSSQSPSATSTQIDTNVYLDEKVLRHILTNLLTNGIKYSPQGGTLQFTVSLASDAVTFRIQDQGIGIPEPDQAHLFETFHRGQNVGRIAGTGLGLAIVKRCVDLHGGTIAVESKVNVGTTFTVTLPLKNELPETLPCQP